MSKSKRFFIHLLVIVMAFSFTSCISIVEEIFFKKNGSGTYSMTLDMSKVANMMAAFGDDNEEMSGALNEMNKEFVQARERLEALEGVSNVRQDIDKEKLIMTMLFDFEDVAALNRGMSDYFRDETAGKVAQYEFFSFSKKQIVRSDKDVISQVLKEQMQDDNDPDFDPSVILSDMYFETILKFDRGFKKFSNEDYQVVDKNTIRWKKYLFNKSESDKKIGVSVTTK